jgi:hypothetical protein
MLNVPQHRIKISYTKPRLNRTEIQKICAEFYLRFQIKIRLSSMFQRFISTAKTHAVSSAYDFTQISTNTKISNINSFTSLRKVYISLFQDSSFLRFFFVLVFEFHKNLTFGNVPNIAKLVTNGSDEQPVVVIWEVFLNF